MKILVVGRGWVGRKVAARINNVGHEATVFAHSHIFDAIERGSDQIDWVVNCAGVTGVPNVDACENDPMGTMEGNATFPIVLQRMCEKHNIKFGHVSSGCIYEGNIDDVNAKPNYFGSIYSISKGISDAYLRNRAQVYRVRMPFTGTLEDKNFLVKVRKYALTGKLFEGGPNSLTDLDEAAIMIADLVTTNQPYGYYNLVNKGSLTMHEIAELMQLSPEWFTQEEFQQATAAGRSNCVIPAYHRMSPVRDAVQNAVARMGIV